MSPDDAKPRRWASYKPQQSALSGTFARGVPEAIAAAIGAYTVEFAHLETVMMDVLGEVLGDYNCEIIQPIWAAIQNNSSRVRLMNNVLQNHPRSKDVDDTADEIIRQFDQLRIKRNDIIHGIWTYEVNREELWLTSKVVQDGLNWFFQPSKRIEPESLAQDLQDVVDLIQKVQGWRCNRVLSRARSTTESGHEPSR